MEIRRHSVANSWLLTGVSACPALYHFIGHFMRDCHDVAKFGAPTDKRQERRGSSFLSVKKVDRETVAAAVPHEDRTLSFLKRHRENQLLIRDIRAVNIREETWGSTARSRF